MGGACSAYEGEDWSIKGFGGKPEGKRSLGILRHRWKDIIKISGMLECGLDRTGLG
jgi:hypothetical protein